MNSKVLKEYLYLEKKKKNKQTDFSTCEDFKEG